MKHYIIIIFTLVLSSCGINKRIAILEKEIESLQSPNYEIIEKGKGYYGKHVTYVGIDAGKYNKASENVFIGNSAGATSHMTRNSLLVGYHAGVNSRGYGNVILGNYAGGNVQGQNNVIIGKAAAQGKLGDRNIVIGTHAGRQHGDFSNKLIIESSESNSPLIYGDFKTDKLDINADLKINGSLRFIPLNEEPKEVSEGLIYYDYNTKKLKIWNGEEWINLN
ncbi:hypothetical protein [Wenyingzhuangia sp. 2_MG-2023]|nr:hypothetical protein [Wenyingzhuangia sp. 2_MG-2023]MDO6739447.1 hypothetical protein [Wenyingzhuangia sp. 2_MG-2023]